MTIEPLQKSQDQSLIDDYMDRSAIYLMAIRKMLDASFPMDLAIQGESFSRFRLPSLQSIDGHGLATVDITGRSEINNDVYMANVCVNGNYTIVNNMDIFEVITLIERGEIIGYYYAEDKEEDNETT